MKEKQKEPNAAFEDLFSRATEDVSAFRWACFHFSDPPEGYDPGYLLLLALASRSRARMALSRAAQADPGYQEHAGKLARMFGVAETEHARLRAELGPSFAALVREALDRESHRLSRNLSLVNETGADADLFGVDPTSYEGFTDGAHAFVLEFSDLARARSELALLENGQGENGAGRFAKLEQEFAASFGYFAPVADLMAGARSREYGDDPWWLSRAPDPAEVPRRGISEAEADIFREAFRREAETAAGDCPRAPEAIAFALSEIGPEAGRSIMAHAAVCRYCRRLIVDVSSCESGEGPGPPPADAEPALEAGLEERFPFHLPPRPSGLRRAAAALAVVLAVFLLAVLGTNALRKAEKPPEAAALPEDPVSRLPIPRLIAPLVQGLRTGEISVSARRHRGMYLGGVVTGFSVFPVAQDGQLKSGDEFRIHVSVKPESYVYVFFHDSSGKISALASAKLPAGKTLTLPDRDAWFSLDKHPGTETIWLLAVNRPLLRFEARLELLEALGIGAIDKIFPDIAKTSLTFRHEA
ncbi:MAG: DUF4384 domain-containing protein [Thermodesulfobacteriota bacterium]